MSKKQDPVAARILRIRDAAIALAELLFTDGSGATRAENDLAGVLEAAIARIRSDEHRLGTEIESLRRKYADNLAAINGLNDRIADLERQLAEMEQYLAVAEGQADDGPPGWIMQLSSAPQYNRWRKKLDRRWFIEIRRLSAASSWGWSVFRGTVAERKGLSATAREAIAAAEAAYQEAIASHGG